MLLVTAPGIVRDRARVPDHVRRLLDLFLIHPAGFLDEAGRVAPAQADVVLKCRSTRHLPLRGSDGVFSFEREACCIPFIAPGCWIISDKVLMKLVPCDVSGILISPRFH